MFDKMGCDVTACHAVGTLHSLVQLVLASDAWTSLDTFEFSSIKARLMEGRAFPALQPCILPVECLCIIICNRRRPEPLGRGDWDA